MSYLAQGKIREWFKGGYTDFLVKSINSNSKLLRVFLRVNLLPYTNIILRGTSYYTQKKVPQCDKMYNHVVEYSTWNEVRKRKIT